MAGEQVRTLGSENGPCREKDCVHLKDGYFALNFCNRFASGAKRVAFFARGALWVSTISDNSPQPYTDSRN